MTHHVHDHLSIQDMMFILAEDRIADLRTTASASDHAAVASRAPGSPGIVARSRDALGRGLMTLGGALVADEELRQRALDR